MNFSEWSGQWMELHPWGVSCRDTEPMVMERIPAYGQRYLNLRSDRAFKYAFGKESHKCLLIDLLNSLSAGKRSVRELHYGAVERQGDTEGVREVRYDLQCTCDQGEQFLIEMQRDREAGFFNRLLYYAMRLGSEQIPAGKRGDQYPLSPICAVAIVDFDLWKGITGLPLAQTLECINIYTLENTKFKSSYPASLELMLVELPKFNKDLSELTTHLDRWLFLLKNLSDLRERPASFNHPVFQKLFQITDYSKISREEEQMIIDHERDLRNKLSVKWEEGFEIGQEKGLDKGLKKGLDKGLVRGREESKFNTAENLIKQTDMDDRTIASIVELDEQVVRLIRERLTINTEISRRRPLS